MHAGGGGHGRRGAVDLVAEQQVGEYRAGPEDEAVAAQRDGDFEFRSGPIFTHLLLADEINRAPPKTQSALLEAMEERQVSADG